MTQDQVATRVGISKPYLSNIETGKVRNPPSDAVLRALEKAMSFVPGELMRIGHLDKTPVDIRQRYESLLAEVQKLHTMVEDKGGKAAEGDEEIGKLIAAGVVVPVINSVAAGYPHHFTDLDYPPGVADEYTRCPDVHDPQAFAARVIGDSMEPQYHEGDLVIFSPKRAADSGDDCFVRFGPPEEGTTFKRIYQDSEDTIRLQPLNSSYPAQTVPREQITGLWPAIFRIQPVRGD